jgi:hypothetical protein
MFNSVEKPQAIWKRKLRQAGRELHRWNRNLIYSLIEIIILCAATTLIAGLIIAAICQVLAVRRIFYEGRGLANRIMWVLLFITVSAHILTDRSQIDFPIAIWLSVLPSMCMFATCLTVCARLLPELTPIGILEMTRRFRSFVTSPE